jgi:hypothetical protein
MKGLAMVMHYIFRKSVNEMPAFSAVLYIK